MADVFVGSATVGLSQDIGARRTNTPRVADGKGNCKLESIGSGGAGEVMIEGLT